MIDIDPDIRRARTLPSAVYSDAAWFDQVRARVLGRAWLAYPGHADLSAAGALVPWQVGDAPVVLARGDDGAVRCLSNVCTHRGNLLVAEPCAAPSIRCRYHGRRFRLDGRFESMPEFDEVDGFPSAADDLPQLPTGALGPVAFASLDPAVDFDAWLAPVRERLGWLPVDEFRFDGATEYAFDANWALYCDNYLEGFHIPFVHPALNKALDYSAYETELIPHGVLQIGNAEPGEPTFELPDGHPDAGRPVGAYYYWLFPTTMLNFYPWGLSLNAVVPEAPTRTRVVFANYVWRDDLRERGAGAGLDQVELEDEEVVLACQRGVRSPLYDRGRYSPSRERGVHHFHRMLAAALAAP